MSSVDMAKDNFFFFFINVTFNLKYENPSVDDEKEEEKKLILLEKF